MADITSARVPQDVKRFIPGVVLAGAIAFAAAALGNVPAVADLGLGALTLAIIVGIAIGNTFYPSLHSRCDEGVQFAKQKLLRLGIILYGFRLTFQQVTDVGLSGVVIDVVMLTSTFLLASYIGSRLMGIDRKTSWLIGAGSSIWRGSGTGDCAGGQSRKLKGGRCRGDRGDFRYAGDLSLSGNLA